MNQSTANSQSPEHARWLQTPIPRVTIGMPVYNGENYIDRALKSLLTQNFQDFELIISDNGSTDRTEEICRAFAAKDSRIYYQRNEINRGASWNYNNVATLARGEFFMWAAHDDMWAPEYVERCVEALTQHRDAVLAYTGSQEIDENDVVIRSDDVIPAMESPKPYVRFNASWRTVAHLFVFGLIRTDVLRKTQMVGNYASQDWVLAAHLALLGSYCGIKDYLFFYRRHGEQSSPACKTRRDLRVWYDPLKANDINFPQWRLLREYLIVIHSVPLSLTERLGCYASLLRWMARKRWRLLANLFLIGGVPKQRKPPEPQAQINNPESG